MSSKAVTVEDGPENSASRPSAVTSMSVDPRALLADWANANDEWVRLLVSEVISTGRPVGASAIEKAYQLFRQEKGLDKRELPVVPQLNIDVRSDESAPPLTLTRLSNVHGVNALTAGGVIEPYEGLTILYGENGTGKTGYSRIFKALANSRTADTILGNIDADTVEAQSATIEFMLGDDAQNLTWTGDRGVSPFTRMSIFDSPAVRTYVDEDLDYVYTPASLALFNDVTTAIQAMTVQIDAAIAELDSSGSGLLARFQRGSTVYPFIKTLGSSTDLVDLKSRAKTGDAVEEELDSLTQTVAALRANTMGTQITVLKSEQRILTQSLTAADTLVAFNQVAYNDTLAKYAQLTTDYETFRGELFAAADLPAEPDDTWHEFIKAGETYRQHLVSLEAHDADRCLYCRQPLVNPARDLLNRYSTYLEDKISTDIRATETMLNRYKSQIAVVQNNEMITFLGDHKDDDEDNRPVFFGSVDAIEHARDSVAVAVAAGKQVDIVIPDQVSSWRASVDVALTTTCSSITELEAQQLNRAKVLGEKQMELLEIKDAAELGKSWAPIEAQVNSAKEVDRLLSLKHQLPGFERAVTALAKNASDQLINQSFDALFLEECEALRAPSLKVQFVGRSGKTQRRKVMNGKHKPSAVLSEGEQKVLALADFLAEVRLSGVTAPVIFDDPVSSLDHRRVNEVARRIARLVKTNQVIVFTHDILFATSLLALAEKSKRCSLFQITDEGGKGRVSRATGLRTDSLKAIKGRINDTIQKARTQEGERREALVRSGYSHIRAWCEVFTEEELLRGVTKRYRANVQMTTLPSINGAGLDEIGPKVAEIFDLACRFIDGHSQPLITLDVSPTLSGLEQHWAELQKLKQLNEPVIRD